MTPAAELESVSPEGEAEEALRKIRERDVRQLPVMRDGELVGLIRRRDFVRWMQLSGR
jgi:CBS domain-containing protein